MSTITMRRAIIAAQQRGRTTELVPAVLAHVRDVEPWTAIPMLRAVAPGHPALTAIAAANADATHMSRHLLAEVLFVLGRPTDALRVTSTFLLGEDGGGPHRLAHYVFTLTRIGEHQRAVRLLVRLARRGDINGALGLISDLARTESIPLSGGWLPPALYDRCMQMVVAELPRPADWIVMATAPSQQLITLRVEPFRATMGRHQLRHTQAVYGSGPMPTRLTVGSGRVLRRQRSEPPSYEATFRLHNLTDEGPRHREFTAHGRRLRWDVAK